MQTDPTFAPWIRECSCKLASMIRSGELDRVADVNARVAGLRDGEALARTITGVIMAHLVEIHAAVDEEAEIDARRPR